MNPALIGHLDRLSALVDQLSDADLLAFDEHFHAARDRAYS